MSNKLILVSAPAGYGKTSLLTEWTKDSQRHVAWLILDEADNDPTRFWSYFIATLESISTGFEAALKPILQVPQHFSFDIFLAGLIEVVSENRIPITIILDDYQLIETLAIHDVMIALIARLPSQINIIISSRSDPPFPLGRLRLDEKLYELRAEDFRFDIQETEKFLKKSVNLDFSKEEIALLSKKTEGWVAGIQLAILSLRNYSNTSDFLSCLSGDNRYIADYLVEEVLQQQPEDIQQFLLQTSILNFFSYQVCDYVTGVGDCYKLIDYLEENNMFLIPLDNNRLLYRYHPLFADLLKRRLMLEYPEKVEKLHIKASQWFEEHDFINESIGHALTIKDYERAAYLTQENILEKISRGEFETIRSWLRQLPENVICHYPWLEIGRIWDAVFLGKLAAIEKNVNRLMGNLQIDDEDNCQIRGHILTIMACINSLQGNQANTLAFSEQALSLLPEHDQFARGLAALNLGISLRWNGDLSAALKAYETAQQVSKKSGDSFVYVYSSTFKGFVLVLQGKLRAGYKEYLEALREFQRDNHVGEWISPIMGLLYSFLSGILLEWNRVEEAFENAERGLKLSKIWGNKQAIQDGYFFYIQALVVSGKVSDAQYEIEQAREVAEEISPFQELDVFFQESKLYLKFYDLDHVERLIQQVELHQTDSIDFFSLQTYQILAKYLRAIGDFQGASYLLERMIPIAKQAGALGKELEIYVDQSLVAWVSGNKLQAIELLEEVMAIAEPEGYLRVFINEGEQMFDLLKYAAQEGIHSDYIHRILSACYSELVEQNEENRLVQPLSKREKQVLRLLISGLTSNEVADTLTISSGTARTHIRNLYRKLDVHNRVEAVNKARELNLT